MLKKILPAFIVVLIIFSSISISSASSSESAEYKWTSVVDSRTLGWGDSTKYKEYEIKANDFTEEGYVSILLYKNGQLEKRSPLHVGGSIEIENEIRVVIKKVELRKKEGIKGWVYPIEPRVTIQILKAEKKVPEIEITIDTGKDTYDPKKSDESTFTSKIIVENEGNEDLVDVNVSLDIDSMKLIEGGLNHTFSRIPAGESESIEIKIETPLIWDSDKFTISSMVNGSGPDGDYYSSTEKKKVRIEQMWDLKLTKAFSEILYVDQKAYCNLIIRNAGLVSLDSIQVFDSICEEIGDNNSVVPFNTTLSLEPGETVLVMNYSLTPDMPGIFQIPEATAIYFSPDGKEHEISSGEQKCEVVGPHIILKKSTDPDKPVVSEEITVRLQVENVGNVDAYVTVDDQLPDNSIILKGDPYFHDVIKKGSSVNLSYSLVINEEGEARFPPAKATSMDMKGYKGTFESNPLQLVVLHDNVGLDNGKNATLSLFSIISVYVVLCISSIKIMLWMAKK